MMKRKTAAGAAIVLAVCLLLSTVGITQARAVDAAMLGVGGVATGQIDVIAKTGKSGAVDFQGICDITAMYGDRDEEIKPFVETRTAGGDGICSQETYNEAGYNSTYMRRDLLRVSPKFALILIFTVKRDAAVTIDNATFSYGSYTAVQLSLITLHGDGENTVTVSEQKIRTNIVDDGSLKHTVHAKSGDTVTVVLETPSTYRYGGQTLQSNDRNKDLLEFTFDPSGYDADARYKFDDLHAYKLQAQALSERFAAYPQTVSMNAYGLDKQLEILTLCEKYAAEVLTFDLSTDLDAYQTEAFTTLAAVPTLEQQAASLAAVKSEGKAELAACAKGKSKKQARAIVAEAEAEIDAADTEAAVFAAVTSAKQKLDALKNSGCGSSVVGASSAFGGAVALGLVGLLLKRKKQGGQSR